VTSGGGKEIRILRVIARLNIGGPAIQAVMLSDGLGAKGFRTLLACGAVSPGEGDMGYLAREKGVKPVSIPFLGRNISPLDDFRAFFALRNLIRSFDPDLVHTHTAKAGTLGRLAALSVNLARPRRRRIRMVHTFHGHVFQGYFKRWAAGIFIAIERFLARFTDRIVVISDLQKHDICSEFKIAPEGRVRVIRLGFDLSPFVSSSRLPRDDFPGNRRPFNVVSVGRLTAVKNHAMLVDAAAELVRPGEPDDFRFTLVGDGELKEDLSMRARRAGVDSALVFGGWRRDMPEVYASADAVALTSKNEGTPVALIEAMAAGCPVISTDVGGVRALVGEPVEKIGGGVFRAPRGLLVRSGDGAALARGLRIMRDDPVVRRETAERAAKFIVEKYGVERLFTDIDLLYRKVLES
jgi:glycosyltransferase involved in cell wall biosynthesis